MNHCFDGNQGRNAKPVSCCSVAAYKIKFIIVLCNRIRHATENGQQNMLQDSINAFLINLISFCSHQLKTLVILNLSNKSCFYNLLSYLFGRADSSLKGLCLHFINELFKPLRTHFCSSTPSFRTPRLVVFTA